MHTGIIKTENTGWYQYGHWFIKHCCCQSISQSVPTLNLSVIAALYEHPDLRQCNRALKPLHSVQAITDLCVWKLQTYCECFQLCGLLGLMSCWRFRVTHASWEIFTWGDACETCSIKPISPPPKKEKKWLKWQSETLKDSRDMKILRAF